MKKDITKNVERYMKLKGIRFQTELLRKIGFEIGKRGEQLNKFVENEKGNFSKMIRGQRSLNDDYIAPMEKVLGVSLLMLEEPDAYKLPIEKDGIPYQKGFRYYAYMDDPKLYDQNFERLIGVGDDRPLERRDEFGKTFLDYVVEYNSINSLLYLYKKYEFRMQILSNSFFLTNMKDGIYTEHAVEIARMIASTHNPKMFFDIFNPYEEFAYRGYNISRDIFTDSDFLEIILDNQELFETLFIEREYTAVLSPMGRRSLKIDSIKYRSISPIINNCLNVALHKMDKYKEQAIKILNYGLSHNSQVINKIGQPHLAYFLDEKGGIRSSDGKTILGTIIIAKSDNSYPDRIKHLINLLPAPEIDDFGYIKQG